MYGDSYIEGESITVIAEPDGDNVFLGWFDGDSEKCLSDEEEYSFYPSSDIILSAKFGSHTHVWATEWSRDDSYHWHECEAADACCFTINSDKNGYGEHSFGEWQTVTEATCTADGSEERICSVCKYAETRGIALNPSAHNLSKIEAKAATCTAPGNNAYWACKTCGKVFKDAEGITGTTVETETFPATGHNMTKTDAKEATCTEPGNNAYWTCKTCEKVFKDAKGITETTVTAEILSTTGHSMTKTDAKAPTCTNPGNKDYWTCGNCGKVFQDAEGVTETAVENEVISALGHDWSSEWNVIREATEAQEGRKEKSCENGCGQKQYETILRIGGSDEFGNVEKNVEAAPGAPETFINTWIENLVAGLLTKAERAAVEGGADAKIWLEIKPLNASEVSTSDMDKIKTGIKKYGEKCGLLYFDANLFKKVGGADKVQIYEAGMTMSITVSVPDEFLNKDDSIQRKYYMVRVHDGEVSVLDGVFDEERVEFTFETDRFSTYALMYVDTVKVAEVAPETPEKAPEAPVLAPETGDFPTCPLLALFFLACMGVMYCNRKRFVS